MCDSPPRMAEFAAKMEAEALPPVVADTFGTYYRKLVTGEKGLIPNRDIRPVARDEIAEYQDLDEFSEKGRQVFHQSVMIRLNGGLGTSMGLSGPKSSVEVKDGRTFLELIVRQAEQRRVRLALMNSFNTHRETHSELHRIGPAQSPLMFLQNKFPKVLDADFSPARWPENPKLEWNPPGHGDVYTALYTSGILDELLAQGIRYAFIANIDNLGAAMDAALLGYFAEKNFPFMMEVAEKTPSDIKGGHLARLLNGRLVLRESAQCPADELDAFRDIRKYRFFNTNNIWINLEYVNELFQSSGILELPMIVNPKTVDPRDKTSPAVYQIETAMGAAISLFQGATAVRVPRSRFLPVKKCSDLLALRSDCFVSVDDSDIVINPRRTLGELKIQLDDLFYAKIDDFDARFPSGAPSLVDCAGLTVEGNVFFKSNIKIIGSVKITNTRNEPATIEPGTVIDCDLLL
jgi:UTP--glucose-1-phosphate uridylyltransferase